jgi:heme oxygenase
MVRAMRPSSGTASLKTDVEATARAGAPPEMALSALRAATRSRHNTIDRLMDLRRMAEPGHYARTLQVFDAFMDPWEHAVLAALPAAVRPWLLQRSRRPFLRQDLQALGLDPLPLSPPRLPLPDAAAGWGSLYVIEGSALGGQAITRALAHAGLRPDQGGAYFQGWGSATGTMWAEFRGVLARELATPAAVTSACDAACRTFDTLSALLEPVLHERPALA